MKSRVCEGGTQLWLNPNVAILCWCDAVAGLSYWNNYSSHNSPFVRQEDSPSSSLCHVQSSCSSRPQIGCLTNTECFDKWLCPVHLLEVREIFMVLGDDARSKTGGMDLQSGQEWLEFTHVIHTPSVLYDSMFTSRSTWNQQLQYHL